MLAFVPVVCAATPPVTVAALATFVHVYVVPVTPLVVANGIAVLDDPEHID
jgi:hypothetical protein